MNTDRRAFLASIGGAVVGATLNPTLAIAESEDRPEKRISVMLAFPTPAPGQGIETTVLIGKLFSYTAAAAHSNGTYLVTGIVPPRDKSNRYALEINVYSVEVGGVKTLLKPDDPLVLTKEKREMLRTREDQEVWVTLGVAEGKG